MGINRCKGTRDLSPEEMAKFHLIEGAFRDCCLKWGYKEVKTPVLEYLHLFTSAGTLTPNMLSRVYSFLDWDGWSGERVVLRPDVTIPVARLYIEKMKAQELAKLFYVANVFSFEATGEKTRERWQCGAELIGVGSPLSDVELITLSLEILRKLRFNRIELKLSHAGFIKTLLRKLGLTSEEQAKVLDQILDGDGEALSAVRADRPELEKVLAPWFDKKGKSAEFIRDMKSELLQSVPELEPQINDFESIIEQLQTLGYKYQIDITSVRGFEYYTGVIFQLFAGKEKIGAGGRYDDLIPSMGGKDTPASGFALYLDRLIDMVKPQTLAGAAEDVVLVSIENNSEAALAAGFNIANRIRESGFIAEMYLGDNKQEIDRWRLHVREESPVYVLVDRANNRKYKAQTSEEIVKLIESGKASKGD